MYLRRNISVTNRKQFKSVNKIKQTSLIHHWKKRMKKRKGERIKKEKIKGVLLSNSVGT
jgi:hypothetical protein